MNEMCGCDCCKQEPILEKLTKNNFEQVIWRSDRIVLHRKHLTLYRINCTGKMKSDDGSWVKCVMYHPLNDYSINYTRSITSFIENFVPIHLEEFEDRLLNEKYQLEERTTKLEKFINENPKFIDLSKYDKILMGRQYDAMCIYLSCLEARIHKMLKPKIEEYDALPSTGE